MKLLLRTQKDGVAKLYTKIKIQNTSSWLCLGMGVSVKDWDKTFTIDSENKLTQSDVKAANLMRKMGYSDKLQQIENGLRGLREKNTLSIETARNLVETIVLADVRAEAARQAERMAKLEEAKKKDVKCYVDKFVASLTGKNADSMTKKGTPYKERSIKIWEQFHRVFCAFYRTHKIGAWDDVDKKYIDKFSAYLDARYMVSTKVRYISCFRTIMGRAFAEEVRTKAIASDMFYRPVVHAQDAATEIYLTNDELTALYNMKH